MASATSLRGVLARVPASKRELVIHLPLGADTKELYVASVATKIYVGPQATLAPLGFASAARYVKRALDKVGIEPEVYARGRFKSAGEQLVRESMTEPQREQVGALLDTFYDEVVDALARGRNVTPERARALIDGAPYLGAEAVAAGLVDGVAYEDELPALLGKGGKRARLVSGHGYQAAMRAPRFAPLRRPGLIGVVCVHGPIASQSLLLPSRRHRRARSSRRIRLARRDSQRVAGRSFSTSSIRAGGGAPLASDRIPPTGIELDSPRRSRSSPTSRTWRTASGGCYVAAAAHAIVAQPTTITGSIGVVAARFVVEPLLAKLGVSTEVLKRGAHADMLQPTRHLSAEEGRRFQHAGSRGCTARSR